MSFIKLNMMGYSLLDAIMLISICIGIPYLWIIGVNLGWWDF